MRSLSALRGPGSRPGALAPPAVLLLAAVIGCRAAPPAEWTIDLEPLLVLGSGEVGLEEAFYEPTGLGVDGAGNVHVLDTGNARVQVFSPEGDFLRSLGGAGEGPGELSRPGGLWVYPDGEVLVADSGGSRLVRYGPGGGVLPAVPLEFIPLDVVGTPGRIWVLRLPPPALVTGSDPSPLVHGFDRDGRPLHHGVAPAHADIGLLYFLQNALRIAPAPDGGFAVADTHVRSRIRVHDESARIVRSIPVLYKAEAWAALGRLPETLDEGAVDLVARTSTDLAWDPGRRLFWVLAGHVDRDPDGSWATARELYRYAPDGSYRGSVILPFQARRVAPAIDGSVWLLDAEGVVRRMRVVDPEAA